MNKIKYLGIALAATLASCSTNDFDTAPAINGNGMITAYTPQSGESTRTAYEADGSNLKVTWSATDENMYTINAYADGWTAGQLKQVSAAENGASANFNAYDIDGTKQVGYKAGKLFAFYPQNTTVASSFKNLASDGTTATVPLSLTGQSGKLTDLYNYDYMTATADVSVNADNEATVGALNMNHEIAVLHIAQGSEVSLTSGSVTKIELSATSGLYGSGTMTITRNGSTISSKITGTTGTITINGNFAVADNKLSDDVYVAILPATTTFSGLKAKFTYDNGDSYTYNYSGSTTKFEKGKVYNWSPEIAAADKEFSIGTYKREKCHRYETNNATYNNGTYTMDKLILQDSEDLTQYGDFKISLIITVKNGNVAKSTNFKLKSVKAAYAMYDSNNKVDIDRLESFSIQGWYTSFDCSGTPSQSPDATHIYGKCIVGFKQLNLDGSDFYKEIMKNCEFTVVNGYGKEASFTQKYVEEAVHFSYSGGSKNNTYIKFQTPDGWKTLSCAAILAL